ncbi:FACT complex subunit spt16 [Neophaeococcomyces mojaviensis]|uniref:FACT complex subunit spt16 n=1 Tax=Neophaeococcomyces mojaviensis TaxID=3383035 RepID=A0ACC2ZU72_9EURO|nr:FACT complex subunit spt16 [Knufia sp. JES_112]
MADAIVIDTKVFFERLQILLNTWKADKRAGDNQFGGADSIAILTGKSEPENSFVKNNALHFWLLGYEFPATLLVFTTTMMYVVTTEKKAKHLQNLKEGKVPVEILPIDAKKPETRTEAFNKCIDIIKSAGKKCGTLPKIETTGPFADEWKKVFSETSKDVEETDISPGLSQAMSIKDEEELKAIRTGAKAASAVMSDYWVDEMSEVLDAEKKITHAKLATNIAAKIDDQKFFKKVSKLTSDFDNQHLDWAFGPVVQSGGQYDLKLSAQSNNEPLHSGCIIAGLGFRYRTYSSVIARTYLIDPSKSQTANYKILLAAHEAAVRAAKEGAACKDVYNAAFGVIKAKKPELEKHFPKNVGAAIGIELKDVNLTLSGKNVRSLKDGMTLSIITSLDNLVNDKPQDKKGTNYSLLLMDTIRVTRGDPVVFTKDTSTDLDSIEFYFKDEEEEVKPKQEKKKSSASAIVTSNIKSSRTRGAGRGDTQKEEEEARRREHQKELAAKKQREGLEKYSEATGALNGEDEKKFKKFESYKRDSQLPARIKDMIVWVDVKALTVILPIMGRPVPFHINTIKNVSKSDEGEYTHLRFNFLSPGQGVGRKDDQPFEDPQAHFIRSLTVRSKDQDRLSEVSSQITELRKAATRKEQEKKEMEDVVEQEKLVEIRNRRPVRLADVYLRPAQDGKRVPGEVEIHQNGLRYVSPLRNENVDIVFSNVKHLFFQPCVGELIVLIHVHLKNPILVGKRKSKDVQFYREATDMAFDETGNRKRKHRYGDEEEFEQEQEERRRRAELDKLFKSFAEKISDAGREWNITVDIPFRELSFNGVPFRSNVLMAPATDALVQLTEPPFTVVTLEEIEVAHLERIQFGLKNFDLVFVYKDYQRPPTHVNTIPVDQLEKVKEWLDSVDIAYTEGPLNLNWGMIMKTVIADPHQFFKDGGWSFLNTDSDDEDKEEESEEESAFEMSDEELNESESESEDESEFDDDASDDEGDAESDLSDEGEDWDDMEKKAAKADRNGVVNEEDDGGKKRKRR